MTDQTTPTSEDVKLPPPTGAEFGLQVQTMLNYFPNASETLQLKLVDLFVSTRYNYWL